MADGSGWFDWETTWRWIEGVIGTTAIGALSGVGWLVRAWWKDRGKLDHHERFIAKAEKMELLGRVASHERQLREVKEIRKDTEDGRKSLRRLDTHDVMFADIRKDIEEMRADSDRTAQAVIETNRNVILLLTDMQWIKKKMGNGE